MNLNKQPSLDELAQLFAARKDQQDSHILWVSETGDVHLDCLEAGTCEKEFEQRTPAMRARLRTYHRGRGYVGKKAAADREFIGRVYSTLSHAWQTARSQPEVAYIDRYC